MRPSHRVPESPVELRFSAGSRVFLAADIQFGNYPLLYLATSAFYAKKSGENMQKDGSSDDKFSVNLRYLFWRSGKGRDEWVREVVAWLGCSSVRARDLLTNSIPSQREVDVLSEKLGATSEELRFTGLVEELGDDLFLHNLQYLVDGVEHGEKNKVARAVGVHATSLSRWIAGTHHPEKRYRASLARYFGLSSETELVSEPIFLSLLPVSESDRKRWLRSAIDDLDHRSLNDLFPALFKLLS